MSTDVLSDHELVERLQSLHPANQALVDEYYRRCIPAYLEFLGIDWHTGFYLPGGDDIGPEDQARMNRHIADSISLAAGDHVLDVGCGVGGPACRLAREYRCRITGLTPVPAQADAARRIARRMGVCELVDFDLGHAGTLPYADETFDVVLFFESACHFPDRRRFFAEAFRVLRPGGRLAGEDWLAADGVSTADAERWLTPLCRHWAIPALDDGPTYADLMRAAGFDRVRFTDMRTEMDLQRGFAATPTRQADLAAEIAACRQPFARLILEGLASLGRAVAAGAFTIGRFTAGKPDR